MHFRPFWIYFYRLTIDAQYTIFEYARLSHSAIVFVFVFVFAVDDLHSCIDVRVCVYLDMLRWQTITGMASSTTTTSILVFAFTQYDIFARSCTKSRFRRDELRIGVT